MIILVFSDPITEITDSVSRDANALSEDYKTPHYLIQDQVAIKEKMPKEVHIVLLAHVGADTLAHFTPEAMAKTLHKLGLSKDHPVTIDLVGCQTGPSHGKYGGFATSFSYHVNDGLESPNVTVRHFDIDRLCPDLGDIAKTQLYGRPQWRLETICDSELLEVFSDESMRTLMDRHATTITPTGEHMGPKQLIMFDGGVKPFVVDNPEAPKNIAKDASQRKCVMQ